MGLFNWNKKKKEVEFTPSKKSSNKVEFPAFLKEYEKELRAQERPSIRITTGALNDKPLEEKLGVNESKFLGKPFFPKSKVYPIDSNGTPMLMAVQINFAEVPPLEGFPKEGILQLFMSSENWYLEEVVVFYHSKDELSEPNIEDFTFIDQKLYEALPIWKVHRLGFEHTIDYGGSQDSQFNFCINGKEYWEYLESLSVEQAKQMEKYFSAIGHKIGGYAEFTQHDPRDYNDNQKEDIQLLQIDIDDHIMFGDSGVAHLFISPEHLKNQDLEKAYFYWDCC